MSCTHLATSRFGFVQPLRVGRADATALARFARSIMLLLLLGVAYALAARLSQQDLFRQSRFGLFWAPNALVLSALLLSSRRWWPLIAAVSSGAHVLAMAAENPTWRMAWQIAANGAFVLATAELLLRYNLPSRLPSRAGAFVYIGLAFLMPLSLACTAPAFVLSVMGAETLYSPSIAFVRLALANVTPLLFVTPAVLLSSRLDAEWLRSLTQRRIVEGAGILGCVLVVGITTFDADRNVARLPWLVLTLPPLVWAAARLGPAGASLSLLSSGALSLAGAIRQHGPFSTLGDPVLSLQTYWILISPPILLLAAAIREREQAKQRDGEARSGSPSLTNDVSIEEKALTTPPEPPGQVSSRVEGGTDVLWLPHADREFGPVACCPDCREPLSFFPPDRGELFVCRRCGFVSRTLTPSNFDMVKRNVAQHWVTRRGKPE